MKRVGEILKEKRLQQEKSLEDISKVTKIRTYFLSAIEEGMYDELPDRVYVKGFIQSYAQALHLDPQKVLPFYRREFTEEEKVFSETKSIHPKPLITITLGKVMAVAVAIGLTAFLAILFMQYQQFSNAPILIIDSPNDQMSTTKEKINVTGTTGVGNTVTINGEEVVLSSNGTFELLYLLKNGLNKITIISVNKLGKQSEVVRTVEKIVEEISPTPKEKVESSQQE